MMVATPADPTPWQHFLEWAHVESTAGLLLVAFGLIAQALFFGRWVIQWLATEKRGVSHVPLAFWWLSLAGASMLLVYFVLRGDPVGALGQSVGWMIYLRNLYLIRRQNRSEHRKGAVV